MSEHISVAVPQIRVLIHLIPRHLVQHGALQMYYLIMGERQDITLAAVVGHGKRHAVMVVFPEIRIQFHIFAEIMHPAHIPFKGKAQSLAADITGHHRPCRGLLGNRQKARIGSPHHGI